MEISVIANIFFLCLVFWFLFKKGKNEKDDSYSSIIDEYNLFYEKEVLKKDQQKPEDDKILFTDESNIVINAVSKLQFNLLDFKEIEGLPYSCEKISKTIIHQLAYSKDLTSVDRKILILKLSYLYKPKEQLRQRMFDEYVITEFRKLDVTWKYTIRDVGKLPYPREVILGSLIREFPLADHKDKIEGMKMLVQDLADYQEGVGVEDITVFGDVPNDEVMEEMEKLPKEEKSKRIMDLAKGIQVHTHKWEQFNKLCERDRKVFYKMMVGEDLPNDDKSSD